MGKVEDYKRHADECRAMARNSSNEEHRRGLLTMQKLGKASREIAKRTWSARSGLGRSIKERIEVR